MRKNILTCILLGWCAVQLFAQPIRGGFGYGFFGPLYNLSPTIENDLKVPSLLGDGLHLNGVTMLGGGGGYGLLNNNILLGGSGFGYKISDATERGQATFSQGGGFINFGYLHFTKKSMMGFPYFGIGACGMNLELRNDTPDDIFNLGSVTIVPGQSMSFSSASIGLEIGYSIMLLTFPTEEIGNQGGFMVGLQAGSYYFSGIENWHEQGTDNVVPTFSKPYSLSPYIRITIGGGGFFW